ncbi:HU family DNA-binding protein [Brevundimonas sp.]|uniref:HU family DNA-binding protein n=1 Tax=Brevundimonas sp. TaxID=1871086 RepID=UPI003917EC72
MLKSELIDQLAAEFSGLRKPEIERAVEAVFVKIQAGLNDERRVELRGFGVFRPSVRIGHTARNPKTGAAVFVPERLAVRFHIGSALHLRLNGLEDDAHSLAKPTRR